MPPKKKKTLAYKKLNRKQKSAYNKQHNVLYMEILSLLNSGGVSKQAVIKKIIAEGKLAVDPEILKKAQSFRHMQKASIDKFTNEGLAEEFADSVLEKHYQEILREEMRSYDGQIPAPDMKKLSSSGLKKENGTIMDQAFPIPEIKATSTKDDKDAADAVQKIRKKITDNADLVYKASLQKKGLDIDPKNNFKVIKTTKAVKKADAATPKPSTTAPKPSTTAPTSTTATPNSKTAKTTTATTTAATPKADEKKEEQKEEEVETEAVVLPNELYTLAEKLFVLDITGA